MKPNPFTLLLFDTCRHGEEPLERVDFGLDPTGPREFPDPAIQHPIEGETVSMPFTPYGTTTKSSVTAQMVQGSVSKPVAATVGNGGWHATFTDLGPGDWTLNVYAGSATGNPADTRHIHVR
jgi:hypothetical protein